MSTVYLSVGSNLGDREQFVNSALSEIGKQIGEITRLSDFYETEPWGFDSKNRFINIAVEVETSLPPLEVLCEANNIEFKLGRRRKLGTKGYEDRVIDIDILLYDDIVLDDKRLTLPHPKMHLRDFVIRPMLQIAPNVVHPILKKSIKELSENLF